jgi:Tfp pilus assembly PilM family ATPase
MAAADENVSRAPRQAFDLSDADQEVPAPKQDEAPKAAPADVPVDVPVDLSLLGSLSDESGRDDFSSDELFDAMWPALNDLMVEIRRSLEYYSGRYQAQPSKILLCGGTARLPGLDKLIETELGISVEVANPLHNVTVFSKDLSDDYLNDVAAVLPVSVGLAARDMVGE